MNIDVSNINFNLSNSYFFMGLFLNFGIIIFFNRNKIKLFLNFIFSQNLDRRQ